MFNDIDLTVEGQIWDMVEGNIVSVKIGENVYSLRHFFDHTDNIPVPAKTGKPSIKKRKQSGSKPRGIKVPYLIKWIRSKNCSIFTLEQFYKDYPQFRKRKWKLNSTLAKLIAERKLLQVDSDKFKIIGDV